MNGGGLEARGLRAERDGRAVVDDVSFTARPYELLALHGPSGSGKSTLLSLLGGLATPDAGTVSFDGRPVVAGAAAQDVGMLLQGYALLPVLTAAENVEVVLQARGVPAQRVGATAEEALRRVLLHDLGDRVVDRLSGGQQQRVALARAIAHRPALLLVDEPTSELDEATRDHVIGELRREAARGAVVVVATHDPVVIRACDRRIPLVDGRVP
jgi:ABC-type lipoprotein export system ATPase subunit